MSYYLFDDLLQSMFVPVLQIMFINYMFKVFKDQREYMCCPMKRYRAYDKVLA